ncbi:hypothetical protein KUTeg_007298 [Tegillarca granosa]|uniref:Uncharacterized protein n=1 Tax=Tegillarca granosa TaxID=220873 RepID=A0ABQ9FHG1_TEGGR|nr:hypothetical protein KUTeg_007298 [Tegillarca granosa]
MGAKQSFPVIKLDKEKNVIVTGANTGIGYEVAKWIAMMGATVIIACRSEEKAKTAIEKMKKDFLSEKQKIEEKTNLTDELLIEFMMVDMSSLRSVKSFIDEFKSSGRKLHALVCNAGVFNFNAGKLSEPLLNNALFFTNDVYIWTGLYSCVNYLSHFLITLHLLPVMLTSGPDCRIVFVSSEAYGMGNFNKEEMERKSKDFRIGYEVAKWIAMMGATVIIACRSEEKAKTAIEKMKKDFLSEKQKIEENTNLTDELLIEFMKVDMSSLRSVKSFIDEFKSSGRKLHALVCNAGVNYLSHFLITLHLLPVMLTSGPDCRIVFVSSDGYVMADFDKDEIERKSKYVRKLFLLHGTWSYTIMKQLFKKCFKCLKSLTNLTYSEWFVKYL